MTLYTGNGIFEPFFKIPGSSSQGNIGATIHPHRSAVLTALMSVSSNDLLTGFIVGWWLKSSVDKTLEVVGSYRFREGEKAPPFPVVIDVTSFSDGIESADSSIVFDSSSDDEAEEWEFEIRSRMKKRYEVLIVVIAIVN